MPDYGGAVRAGSTGALGGFAVGGPVGAVIGGGLGVISGLLSDSPEQTRQKRMGELLGQIAALKTKTINEGMQRLGKQTAGTLANVRAAAIRRARAAGDTNTEAYTNPVESNVADAGSRAGESFLNDTTRSFDQATLNAQMDFAGRPIEPNLSDYLTEIGGAATQYGLAKQRNDLIQQHIDKTSPGNQGATAGFSTSDGVTGSSPVMVPDFSSNNIANAYKNINTFGIAKDRLTNPFYAAPKTPDYVNPLKVQRRVLGGGMTYGYGG